MKWSFESQSYPQAAAGWHPRAVYTAGVALGPRSGGPRADGNRWRGPDGSHMQTPFITCTGLAW